MNKSILFIGKANDDYTLKALKFCQLNFDKVIYYLGNFNDPFPQNINNWSGDYIISYLSRWIMPENILKKSNIAAINFHPASPEYPGFGCINFALYEEAKEYGVTCHYMVTKVDTGDIISVKRFPIFNTDNVSSLLARTYEYQIILFYEIINIILNNQSLPLSKEKWSRKPFTKKQLNELSTLTLDMTTIEMHKRIRATNFCNWKPVIKINECIFELKC